MYKINTQKLNEEFHKKAVTGVEVNVEEFKITFLN